MHVHLDAVGGIAGDMFLAACLDAWPEHAAGAEEAMRTGGLPTDWHVDVITARSHGIAGTRLTIEAPPGEARARPSGHFAEIRRRLSASELDAAVRERAIDIFERLARAEALAHGVSIDDVHFHEIADWDSFADIVGAAWLIEACQATTWSISPLPLGGGTVSTAHGRLPVPAPAVVRLLEGYPMVDDGVEGERVTPTGAAIVAHLEPGSGRRGIAVLGRTGHGLGSRELPDRPNMLRLLATHPVSATAAAADTSWDSGEITVIGFEVDDQTPEDLTVGLDEIRRTNGVVDVTQSPVVGKKGRLGTHVRILCRPDAKDAAIRACFDQTTTIGLRWRDESRAELKRSLVTHDGIAGKTALRPSGVTTSKAEIDAIAQVADTSAERAHARARFSAAGEETL